MSRVPARVVVVGAGVSGLSCAIRLAEAGHRVDVLARDLPLETTSVVAAAIWYPYLALAPDQPRDRVVAWGAACFAELAEIAAHVPGAGVRMLPGTEVLGESEPPPWWAGAVPDLTESQPPPGYAAARSFTAPVVDMPVYLDWLRQRLAELGGTLTRMSMRCLPEAGGAGADVVVNCSGLGSRLLAEDDSLQPVRGQVVHLEGVQVDRWWLDSAGPTYVVPRGRSVVVGGTEEAGEWSRTPSPETGALLLHRARRLVPELAGARVVAHRVGLRPVRPAVRLEAVGQVVHCYGHGGAGVTLSWGCAAEVADLVAGLRS